MNILMLNDFGGIGGAESTMFELKRDLTARGHNVGILVLYKPNFRLTRDMFWQAVFKFKPDVIHLNNITITPEVILWSMETKLPTIWVLHDYYIFCCPNRMLLDHVKQELCKTPCKHECGNFPVPWILDVAKSGRIKLLNENTYSQEIFKSYGINSDIIHCGVDTKKFAYSSAPREGAFVGHADPLAWWKGADIAREACTKLNLPLVHVTPPRVDIVKALQTAKVALVLSRFEETFCKVASEARAAGAILIGSKVAGLKWQTINGVNGFLVDPLNMAEVIDTIKYALTLKEDFRQNARKHIEDNFSDEQMATDYERVYSEVIKDNPNK